MTACYSDFEPHCAECHADSGHILKLTFFEAQVINLLLENNKIQQDNQAILKEIERNLKMNPVNNTS